MGKSSIISRWIEHGAENKIVRLASDPDNDDFPMPRRTLAMSEQRIEQMFTAAVQRRLGEAGITAAMYSIRTTNAGEDEDIFRVHVESRDGMLTTSDYVTPDNPSMRLVNIIPGRTNEAITELNDEGISDAR